MRRKKEERGHEIRERLRPVHCPRCRHRLLDAVDGTKAWLFIPENDRQPDFITKCGHCGAAIGVTKTK